MMVDTGAAVSIIPTQLYHETLSKFPLTRATVKLEAYGGAGISV